jgi:hypothetical protein
MVLHVVCSVLIHFQDSVSQAVVASTQVVNLLRHLLIILGIILRVLASAAVVSNLGVFVVV